MTHPVIPQVIELATPVADKLGLEIVDAVFQTNHNPPVLRLDVRNRYHEDTGLDDCEQMSLALSDQLDTAELLPDAYVLEISSPGLSEILSSDRDFIVFKGFTVEAHLSQPHKGKQLWFGTLIERTPDQLVLGQKGRRLEFPLPLVQSVRLSQQVEE
jgi:ribosome maturation factor RimP